MKKNLFLKAMAALTMIALAVAITVTPGTALATVTNVAIQSGAGESYDIAVGDSVHLSPKLTGDVVGTMVYSWGTSSGVNVSNSDPLADATTITGLKKGTSTVVTLTAYDDASPSTTYKPSITIKVSSMTISSDKLALDGGSTHTLTVGNVSSASATTWESDTPAVATVDPNTGYVVAVGAGKAIITATNTPTDAAAEVQKKTCEVTVSPLITIEPATQNITAANTSGSVKISVQYGGTLITDHSTVAWKSSNSTAGSLYNTPSALVDNSGTLECTADFRSNSTGVNASTTITATISGAGTYKVSKTAVINVRTARYFTVEGDATLNKSDRYGDYTLTLREPDGSVVDNDTSTAHWSWSSSYLSLSNAALNADRAKLTDGVAHIQLYARYNTTSSGTRLYAWVDDASSNRVYTTITISGLSSLPQTGQDMTLIYILGGSAIMLFAAAGVWYGIRKKQTAE